MGSHLSSRGPSPSALNAGGANSSGGARPRTYSTADNAAGSSNGGAASGANRSAAVRSRSRSLDLFNTSSGSLPSDSDSDEEDEDEVLTTAHHHRHHRHHHGGERSRRRQQQLQVPLSFYRSDIKCPVCNKMIPHDDIEVHLIQCLTKPRINYNEDILNEDKWECAICLDNLCQGDTIARLPCLCIYHRGCIEDWFKRSRTCPDHPGYEPSPMPNNVGD